jgi:DNA-binding CsgD family transcriptional regulator
VDTLRDTLDELSPRERQILAAASKGLTDKEIAVKLGLSLTTVRTYWERLFQKTAAVNRASAVALFVKGQATEIPQVPEQPTEPNTLLQAAVDAMVGGVIVLDDDSCVVAANDKAYAMLNCVPGTLETKGLETLIPKRFNAFYSVLQAAQDAEGGSVYTVTSFVRVLGGHDLLASITIRTLETPEGRRIVLFIQDYLEEINARRRGTTYRALSQM